MGNRRQRERAHIRWKGHSEGEVARVAGDRLVSDPIENIDVWPVCPSLV
jgi:hypothetical protein